jgi:hypothetical protein
MAAQENSGVTILRSKGVRGNTKVSWCNKKGRRGEVINIVAQQKMASRCNQKYCGATKEGRRGEIKNIVARQTTASR